MPKHPRFRQIDRAALQCENPELMATVRLDDGLLHIILIPPGKVSEFKKNYGDKLDIWRKDEFVEEADKNA